MATSTFIIAIALSIILIVLSVIWGLFLIYMNKKDFRK